MSPFNLYARRLGGPIAGIQEVAKDLQRLAKEGRKALEELNHGEQLAAFAGERLKFPPRRRKTDIQIRQTKYGVEIIR